MMNRLIECVPNISEGKDDLKIKAITSVVETVDGVKLLDIDSGRATNRTVITFVGEPENVIVAAFLLIKKAAEIIDMSKHFGEHPRFGATDVCPLIPISGITMEETAVYAKKLGKRVGEELGIPGYYYEYACTKEIRRNLANCRAGEYEGLQKKLIDPEWCPDFGPTEFNSNVKKSGAIAIGARDFLIAYNINLNTTSTRRANAIAFDIREAGRMLKDGDGISGKVIKDENGNPKKLPGSLKCVKGIGWYIEEYGVAQISLNLTNINVTPVHIAFDEACKKAQERGLRVTGSELVGLIPLKSILDTANHFLRKQHRSLGISETEKIKIAVKSLGLDDLRPFNPKEKIIEYRINDLSSDELINMSLKAFADETAAESAAPGGGSVSAYVGVLGISLGTMVANLSSHKRGWDDKWEIYSGWAEKGQNYKDALIQLVDEDTNAFKKIMDAFNLPKSTKNEIRIRNQTIQNATKYAIEVPLKVMETAYDSMEVIRVMAEIGMNSSVSDVGVGAACAKTAVLGAFLNVKVNAITLEDKSYAKSVILKGEKLMKKTKILESIILELVESKIK